MLGAPSGSVTAWPLTGRPCVPVDRLVIPSVDRKQKKENRMSYSVTTPCFDCNKKKACTDGVVVAGAVQGIIHAMPFGVGHLGSGKVTLDCQNFEAIPEEAK